MKNLLKLFGLFFLLLINYSYCKSMNYSKLNISHFAQFMDIFEKNPPDTVIQIVNDFTPFFFDTTLFNYSINYEILIDTEYTIKQRLFENILEIDKYPNRKVCIKITNNSNIIYKNCLNKHDFISFISTYEINNFLLENFWFENFKNNFFSFSTNICIPDTDICYYIEIYVDKEGIVTFKEIFEDSQ